MPRALAIFIALAGISLGRAAHAGPPCADRDTIVAKLRTDYSETAGSRGLTTGGGVIEIFSSPQGSWTILLTMPGVGGSLVTCLVAHGESWETLPANLKAGGRSS